MFLCLRVDLNYVPWDAEEMGHGEPAMVLRILDFSRAAGLKLHFFASNRSLRAFPSLSDAVLGEGHHLDWLCTDRDEGSAFREAAGLFGTIGVAIQGVGIGSTRREGLRPNWAHQVYFISAQNPGPPGVHFFPITLAMDADALRSGISIRSWMTEAIRRISESGDSHDLTLCFTPAVLAKLDPGLENFRTILESARRLGLPIRTMRDIVAAAT